MPANNTPGRQRQFGALRPLLILIAVGVAIVAILVAIDRPHWLRLKPATGTAAAMSAAADRPAETTNRAQ